VPNEPRLRRLRSLVVVAACVFSTTMIVAATTPITDPDGWWVAAAGRAMLATHAVPRANVFSFVEPAHAWIMHEWLLGPLYALGLEHVGPSVFAAMAVALQAAALAAIVGGTVGRARQGAAGVAMALLAIVFFGGRFLVARPTSVALLFPIALALVAFGRRFTPTSLLATSLIELAWTNTHGSFPLGVVLLLVAAVERRRDRSLRLAAACVAALATLVNPYGLALHRFVWGYFAGTDGIYRAINANIQEFGPLTRAWGGAVGVVNVVGLALFAALALSALRTRVYRVRALFCLALFALALLHARHLELAGLLGCLLLLPHADDLCARFLAARTTTPEWRRSVTRALVVLPCVLGVVAFAIARHRRSPEAWVARGAGLVRSIDAVPDGANAFVPFAAAGVAIWYGAPRGVRVFFDSRNDCYSASTLEAFWALETRATLPAARRAALDTAGVDTALVQATHPLASFLAGDPAWRLAREDGAWLTYRRAR
jgi:hypothetical protein